MSEADDPQIIKAAEALVDLRRDDFGDTLPYDLLEPMEQEYYLAQARIVAAIVRPASDGKTAGPEGSAQREARSEHIPTPEGRGGEADDGEVMRIWRECGLPEYFLGNGGTNHKLVAFAKAAALLSSPRVEGERKMREALEEARRYLDAVVANSGSSKRRENYAGAVRRIDAALSLQVE